MLDYKIKFRRDKERPVTQCYNCQRYVASNCGMTYRCVNCGGPHGPGKCSIPSKGIVVPESGPDPAPMSNACGLHS